MSTTNQLFMCGPCVQNMFSIGINVSILTQYYSRKSILNSDGSWILMDSKRWSNILLFRILIINILGCIRYSIVGRCVNEFSPNFNQEYCVGVKLSRRWRRWVSYYVFNFVEWSVVVYFHQTIFSEQHTKLKNILQNIGNWIQAQI